MSRLEHQITVSHVPRDEVDLRVGRASGAPRHNVDVTVLHEIVDGLDGDLQNLGAKPDNEQLRDALHSTLAAVQDLARHLIATHSGIADGRLNYPGGGPTD